MRTYYCKIDRSHEGFSTLGAALAHVVKEAKEKNLDMSKPLSNYLEVIDD